MGSIRMKRETYCIAAASLYTPSQSRAAASWKGRWGGSLRQAQQLPLFRGPLGSQEGQGMLGRTWCLLGLWAKGSVDSVPKGICRGSGQGHGLERAWTGEVWTGEGLGPPRASVAHGL